MESPGPRWLIGIGVAAAIAGATSADADVRKRTARDGTYVASAQTKPTYRRTAFTPPTPPAGVALQLSPGDNRAYAREIADAAARYEVPERLIRAVIRVESGFDHRAMSRKGARGLMQLMPRTAKILGVRNSFDPRDNIDGGTRHLRALMDRFGDLRLVLAAYNAGEKTVVAYRGVPPYPETRHYVTQVLRFYEATIEWGPSQGADIQRIMDPNGTIIYTNIPFGQFNTIARAR